jgi:hypothetical protein
MKLQLSKGSVKLVDKRTTRVSDGNVYITLDKITVNKFFSGDPDNDREVTFDSNVDGQLTTVKCKRPKNKPMQVNCHNELLYVGPLDMMLNSEFKLIECDFADRRRAAILKSLFTETAAYVKPVPVYGLPAAAALDLAAAVTGLLKSYMDDDVELLWNGALGAPDDNKRDESIAQPLVKPYRGLPDGTFSVVRSQGAEESPNDVVIEFSAHKLENVGCENEVIVLLDNIQIDVNEKKSLFSGEKDSELVISATLDRVKIDQCKDKDKDKDKEATKPVYGSKPFHLEQDVHNAKQWDILDPGHWMSEVVGVEKPVLYRGLCPDGMKLSLSAGIIKKDAYEEWKKISDKVTAAYQAIPNKSDQDTVKTVTGVTQAVWAGILRLITADQTYFSASKHTLVVTEKDKKLELCKFNSSVSDSTCDIELKDIADRGSITFSLRVIQIETPEEPGSPISLKVTPSQKTILIDDSREGSVTLSIGGELPAGDDKYYFGFDGHAVVVGDVIAPDVLGAALPKDKQKFLILGPGKVKIKFGRLKDSSPLNLRLFCAAKGDIKKMTELKDAHKTIAVLQ